MENNLIFNNGTTFCICPTDAIDAPRMSNGWRSWHIEAAHTDAVTALNSGISCREYESITGVDENNELVTELVREDLSTYTIPGSVCDHMDGTVTIWARRKTDLEIAQTANAEYIENLNYLGIEV